VVIIRERNGRAVPVLVERESAAVPTIRSRVASGTVVYGDESTAWDVLHGSYDTHRVNHSAEFVSEDGASTIGPSRTSRGCGAAKSGTIII
jgi:transposase-like protein